MILEEELKNRVRNDYFSNFENALIIGKIDFCISQKLLGADYSFLWAEAKKGNNHDIYESFIQLILTIGKARTIDSYSPPIFLGAFDAEKIAFIEYHHVMDIFSRNDFNWNVAPSDHNTKEFKDLYRRLKYDLQSNILLYKFERDSKDLKKFIHDNFVIGKMPINKISITKNNFVSIYYKWREVVKATINIPWEKVKARGIIDADFYLADILSKDNATIKDKLYVLLNNNQYIYNKQMDDDGLLSFKHAQFNDGQVAHKQFWNKYTRPPREEFWDYIIERRDLLVEQDIRERKGAFYTPLKWVELSQQYMANYFGEDYQDDYYIWDCAAGTGNLLNGLTNKYKIFASTIDQADVDALKERSSSAKTLLEENVFQFDFLNDSFDKCPKELQDIIKDDNKRKKLIIYINPPYAEAATRETIKGTGANKNKVAVITKVYNNYMDKFGIAGRELFIQFLSRIYSEIPGAYIANFSKLKNLLAPNFKKFRIFFQPKLEKLFIVQADTFDNVAGKFPIGFFIWNSQKKESFTEIVAKVYDKNGNNIQNKKIFSYESIKSINDWLIETRKYTSSKNIGFISCKGCDFQNQNLIFIINDKCQLPAPRGSWITDANIKEVAVYFAVRKVVSADWLNDRDQFIYPHETWKSDKVFQNDCLAYTLFNNNIQSQYGINHWIPFTEQEVEPRRAFESHFMVDYIKGKNNPKSNIKVEQVSLIAMNAEYRVSEGPLIFSDEAQAVFDAGRELWRYYHSKVDSNPNAAFYDIKEYFQGRNEKGRMNSTSADEKYNKIIGLLRSKLKILATKIEPKVYEHGFLIR